MTRLTSRDRLRPDRLPFAPIVGHAGNPADPLTYFSNCLEDALLGDLICGDAPSADRIERDERVVIGKDSRGDRWEEALIIAHHRLQKLGRQETHVSGPAGVSREWEVRHRAFHLALISACGSPWTLHFCGLLHDQFDRYRRSVRTDAKVQTKLAMHHGALVEAALAGAAERARTVLAEHIDQTAEAVVARLRDKPKRKAGAHTMVPPSTRRS